MPKWKLFLWKLWHNSLATNNNLFRRGLGGDGMCPICLYEEESIDHLFCRCPLASEAWDLHMGENFVSEIRHRSFQEWLLYHVLDFRDQEGFSSPSLVKFIGLLWAIWMVRNHQVFRQSRATLEGLSYQLSLGRNHHLMFTTPRITSHSSRRVPMKEPQGFLRSNLGRRVKGTPQHIFYIDRAWDAGSQMGASAWVAVTPTNMIRHRQGRRIAAVIALFLRAFI